MKFVFLFVLLMTRHLFALPVDLGLQAGKIQTNVDPGETVPTLYEVGGSLALKYEIFRFFSAGIVGDYRAVSQLSDPAGTTGNRSGTLITAGPLLEFHSNDFSLKLQSPLIGKYDMPYSTYQGSSINYSSPRGGSARALMRVGPVWAGAYYEQFQFANASFPVNQKLTCQTIGLVIEVRFFEEASAPEAPTRIQKNIRTHPRK